MMDIEFWNMNSTFRNPQSNMKTTPDINKILKLPVHWGVSSWGAQMGRRNVTGEPGRLYLQRVNFIDGDYDVGGAYWGSGGGPLYCAFNDDTMFFVRAENRKEAKSKLPSELNEYGFFK